MHEKPATTDEMLLEVQLAHQMVSEVYRAMWAINHNILYRFTEDIFYYHTNMVFNGIVDVYDLHSFEKEARWPQSNKMVFNARRNLPLQI